ncbi:MAG: DUF4369 domain-containing protein [Pseudoflavonifractor sp.]|nr:DUF4369 domain-containing protein [Pseudoflavonifractor sp.]
MSGLLKYVLLVAVVAVVTGCGGGESFTLAGTVEGLGTQPLRLVYVADGRLQTATITAIDGKFRYEGAAKEPAMVEIFGHSGRLVGRAYISNGETVEGEWSVDNPYKVKMKGNGVSERWARFLTDNADSLQSPATANRVVSRYVESNHDDLLSALLLMTQFDAASDGIRADSLMRLLTPKARPDALTAGYRTMLAEAGAEPMSRKIMPMTLIDTAGEPFYYNPVRYSLSLVCFTMGGGRDSVARMLSLLRRDYPERRLGMLEVSLLPDHETWRMSSRRDSARWPQMWAPGGVAHKAFDYLAVPRFPYLIVSDSTSRQLYRGTSLTAASRVISASLNR